MALWFFTLIAVVPQRNMKHYEAIILPEALKKGHLQEILHVYRFCSPRSREVPHR